MHRANVLARAWLAFCCGGVALAGWQAVAHCLSTDPSHSLSLFALFVCLLPAILHALYDYLRVPQGEPETVQSFFDGFVVGGHRGSHYNTPENCIAAFQKAKSEGAQLMEFDIWLTKDLIPVIIHDNSMKRVTGLSQLISDTTHADLKNIQLKVPVDGSLDKCVAAGESIPTLQDTVLWCKENKMKMIFDVKIFDHNLIRMMVHLIRQHNLYTEAIVAAFNPLVSYYVKKSDPKILTGFTWNTYLCCESDWETASPYSAVEYVFWSVCEVARFIGARYFFIPLFVGADMLLTNHMDIDTQLVNRGRQLGVYVVAWTVNDKKLAEWFSHIGVPYLTDSPAELFKQEGESSKTPSWVVAPSRSCRKSRESGRFSSKALSPRAVSTITAPPGLASSGAPSPPTSGTASPSKRKGNIRERQIRG